MNALVLDRLVKRFGSTTAVDGLHLSIPQGSWFGLIGPNGAARTTTLLMAVGLLRPDAGASAVFGVDVWTHPDEAKAMLGVLPGNRVLPDRLTGPEVLTYLGLLRGMAHAVVAARSTELQTLLGLDGAATTLVSDYSTGMRRKLGLAAALLHDPRLLAVGVGLAFSLGRVAAHRLHHNQADLLALASG